jgi:hypothetical protein
VGRFAFLLDLHDLLPPFLHAARRVVEIELDRHIAMLGDFASRGQIGIQLQEAPRRELFAAQLERAQGEIMWLLDADVDQVDGRARQFLESRGKVGERMVVPGGAGQIGEHIELAAMIVLLAKPVGRVAERFVPRTHR